MKLIEGNLSAQGMKVAIVAGRFNALIVDRLVEGAVDAFKRSGVADDDITVVRCPGAFEIPGVARRVVEQCYDAVVCVGAVIRGSTPHFDYVAGEVAKGVGQIAMSGRAAVTFGVLTTDTIEQAIERAGTKAGNKGFESAMAAIELANVYRSLASKG